MTPQTHPDFLALDRWALGTRPPDVDEHLRTCTQCRAHVERVGTPVPRPASLRVRLQSVESPRPSPVRRWWQLGLAGGMALAAAAAVLLVVRPPPGVAQDGVKGSPAVAIYVLRNGAVSLWDGSGPLRPDDRIQLKVESGGFSYVSVGTGEGREQDWLYSGALESQETKLPVSWRVDEAPGDEELTIVLTRRSLSVPELNETSRAGIRSDEAWTTRLVLPKRPWGAP